MSNVELTDLVAMARIARIMAKLTQEDQEDVAVWVAKKFGPGYRFDGDIPSTQPTL